MKANSALCSKETQESSKLKTDPHRTATRQKSITKVSKTAFLLKAAKAAGVQEKDIIIALGDYPVTSLNGLTRALQNFQGGDVTTITVWRGGVELELEITLDEKPAG